MKNTFVRHAVGIAILILVSAGSQAQQAVLTTPRPATVTLKEVTVTGNPLGATD